MITVQDVELRAGARLLLEGVTFRVQPGDRIGLVGRNGAGKTTLTKTLAKQTLPAGRHHHAQRAGRLPAAGPAHRRPRRAGPRPGAVSAAGSTRSCAASRRSQVQLGESPDDAGGARAVRPARGALHRARRLRRRGRGGPHLLEPRPARAALGPAARHAVRRQRAASSWPGILFSDATTLLLDEPTNHLDADSITWLRGFLPSTPAGSSSSATTSSCSTRWSTRCSTSTPTAPRSTSTTSAGRPTSPARDRREAAQARALNAEKQAGVLNAQAEKMRAKATKAKAAQGMFKRAEKLLAGVEGERPQDKVAKLRFPEPAPCGRRR
jgi:hypothetical protein